MEQPTKSLVFIQYAPSVPEILKLTADKSTGGLYNLLGGPLNTPKNPRAAEIADKFKTLGCRERPLRRRPLRTSADLFAAVAKVGDPTKRKEVGAAIGASDTKTARAHRLRPGDPSGQAGQRFRADPILPDLEGRKSAVLPASLRHR